MITTSTIIIIEEKLLASQYHQWVCLMVLVYLFCNHIHSDDPTYVGSLCSSVGLGICVIEHLSIESSVVDGSTIRVGILSSM